MARNSTSVVIDTASLEALGEAFKRLDSTELNAVGVQSVNAVALRVEARARINLNRYNISKTYVDRFLRVEPARDKPNAVIVAAYWGTGLGRYAPNQITTSVKFRNENIPIGKLGWNPRKPRTGLRWKARIGDKARGIPLGFKQAGISVEVMRGSRKPISYAFVIPGKQSKSEGYPVVFERVGKGGKSKKGKIKSLHGPSVHQIFRSELTTEKLDVTMNDLQQTMLEASVEVVQKQINTLSK